MVFGGAHDAIETALLKMEKQAAESMVESGLVLFCIKCHRVSALSFEYDCALRQWLGLSPPSSLPSSLPSSPSSLPASPNNAEKEHNSGSGGSSSCSDAYYARLMTLFYLRRKLQKNK